MTCGPSRAGSPAIINVLVVLTGLAASTWSPIDARELTIRGEVLARDLEPVAQARVRLIAVENRHREWSLAESGVACARRSRSDGSFELVAPEPGLWRVVVDKEGFVSAEHDLHALLADRSLDPVILDQAKSVDVDLISPSGGPVSDAWILPPEMPSGRPGWNPRLLPVTTSEAGSATVIAPANDTTSSWVVEHFGSWSHELELYGGSVRAVLDPLSEEAGDAGFWFSISPRSTTTGALIIPPGHRAPVATLSTDEKSWLPWPYRSQRHLQILTSLGGEPVPLDLEYDRAGALLVADLGPPLEVQGSVVDKTSERAVSGAFVWLQADPGIWTRSDNHGFFRLPIPPGNHPVLSVDASGYLPTTAPVAYAKPESAYTLPLERAGSAHVLVTSSRGETIAAFTAAIRCEAMPAAHDSRAQGIRRYFGDGNGRLDLQKLLPGQPYELLLMAPGFAQRSYSWNTPSEGGASSIELTLKPANRLDGEVVSTQGEPLANAEALVILPAGPIERRKLALGARSPARVISSTTSDAEGTFQLDELPDGPLDLIVRRPGYSPATRAGIVFEANQRHLRVDAIQLEPGVSFDGVVETTDGQRLDGAELFVSYRVESPGRGGSEFPLGNGQATTSTDSTGRFILHDLQAGHPFNLLIYKHGFVPKKLEALQAPNERPSIITLESGARLSGRVYASDGRVLEGAAVELLPTDASSRRRHRALYVWDSETATDDEGRFQLGGLLPGRFNLRARDADHQPWIQEVQLVEGDTTEVVITLESGALVQGIVETNRGAPVAGATVSSGGSQTRSDGSGQFSLDGIAPGETRVVARHPDHGRTADRVVVEASGSYIQLTFPPGGSLAGAVLDPDGREISAAEVAVMNDLVSPTLRRTDANGRFEFSHLPTTDQLRIIAKKAGFVDAQQISRIVSGEKTEVSLTLVPACSVTGSIRSSLPEKVDAVRVFAAKAAGLTRSGEVGLGGEYRIDGLSDGVWNVTAQGPSGARGEARIECRPDSSLHRVDLDLNDGYALAIRVRSDTPASPARVKIENKDGFVVDSGHTDHFGVFRATGLRAGAYRVRVLSDYGNLTAASVVQIPRNHPLEIYLSSPRK